VSFSGNNISCYGGNNGTAAANVSGGTLPYTYLWSTGDTIQTLANLLPGTYTVGVTDSSGCYTEDSIIITQPSVILTDSLSSTAISCYGGGDGSATAIPSGGVQPYFYSWSNGDTTSTATNLLAATYSVSITDSAGCTIIDTVSLTEPTQLISTTSVVSPACGNSNGSATVTVVGGTLPYTYSWSSGDTTSTVSGLTGAPTDTLTVLITDANNCTDTAVAIVDCSTGTGNISSHNKIIIIPNPAHDYFTIAFSGQLPVDNGQVKIFDMTGRLVHEQQIHSQLSTVNCQLSSGVYFVKVYNGEKVYAQKLVIE
jgi:hypothetical protein